jgi:hypothetical protein
VDAVVIGAENPHPAKPLRPQIPVLQGPSYPLPANQANAAPGSKNTAFDDEVLSRHLLLRRMRRS